MTRSWATFKIELIREGPILLVFCKSQHGLLCFSLMKGFLYLCTTSALLVGACFEPSTQLLFAILFIGHLMSSDNVEWHWNQLVVIPVSGVIFPDCQFVELLYPMFAAWPCFYEWLSEILRMETTWHWLSVKPELNPFFPHSNIFF